MARKPASIVKHDEEHARVRVSRWLGNRQRAVDMGVTPAEALGETELLGRRDIQRNSGHVGPPLAGRQLPVCFVALLVLIE